MKTRIKFGSIIAVLTVVTMLVYIACRKADIASKQTITTEDKFFTATQTNDPVINRVIELLKKQNAKNPFVKKNGKSNWLSSLG